MAMAVVEEQGEGTHPLLSPLPRRRNSFRLLPVLLFALALAALGVALFLLWPADPDLRVARLHLDGVHLSTSPSLCLNVSISLSVKVRNPNFFSLDYDSLVSTIGYRGRKLGSVTSEGGRVGARRVSYLDADLQLNGIRVIHDIFYLLEDYRRGSIPFETITEVQGKLRLFFIDVPVEILLPVLLQALFVNTYIGPRCYISLDGERWTKPSTLRSELLFR
ncbi:hypothetical protein ZIOFF_026793 [Zingiber officinale]|uniref:Late embryogenesis abundant protein LEA-2 subgroup domain-containing protein n=1 Tax=Zingiber officinale TaxID=94328 RepID=A0A8J5LG10_ZINOF|nr:hypothetical protein ZIOFF_026793 [Zingiber officinale]